MLGFPLLCPPKENKYARKSLRTRSEATAIEKGKAAYLEIYANLHMRTLRFKRVKPSVGTLAICASKLQHYGRCMTATEQHTQLGKRFIELSEQCHKQINADAVGWWKDEVRV